MQLLLFRKNHARLACSVVNALTTARCRYQLLRIADSRKGCSYGSIYFSIRAKHLLLFTLHFSLFSARYGLCPVGNVLVELKNRTERNVKSCFWCERRNLNAKLRLPFTTTIICPFCSAMLRKRWTNGFKPRGKCVDRTKKTGLNEMFNPVFGARDGT